MRTFLFRPWQLMYILHFVFLGLILPDIAGAVAPFGSPIRYQLSGHLDDGGEFFGTFTVDPLALDSHPSASFGRFTLTDVSMRVIQTPILSMDGNTLSAGSASEATLFQTAGTFPRQSIDFEFVSDDGLSGVFTDILFGPFSGDPNVATAIAGAFQGGYFDGNGQPNIVSLTLTVIPEPSSLAHVLIGAIGLVVFRCRRYT
ncbi:MAG: PEP-CTERM sorting domain-containing protein [Aeoliella sp.]